MLAVFHRKLPTQKKDGNSMTKKHRYSKRALSPSTLALSFLKVRLRQIKHIVYNQSILIAQQKEELTTLRAEKEAVQKGLSLLTRKVDVLLLAETQKKKEA